MNYDYIIVGSGAGGSAAAHYLASRGAHVLLLEKGEPLPQDGSTQDVDKVIRQGLFKSREAWLDGDGQEFTPEEYFNLGGKTKWYGAAVLRMDAHEFAADPGHQCRAWPIDAAELAPYYEQAERLLGVQVFDAEPDLARIAQRLGGRGWEAQPLPLALAPEIVRHPDEARHFDAFASAKRLKHDAEQAFLDPLRASPHLHIRTGQPVRTLLGAPDDARRIVGVITEDGRLYRGARVLLAAGALHSPRLLQRYLDENGLARRLPVYRSIGRNYKQHLLTAVVGFTARAQTDLLRKTRLLLHPQLPHSSVQPLGFDAELIGALMPACLPRALCSRLGRYAYGFFLQTEDGSDPDNRVQAGRRHGMPRLDYRAERLPPALREHRALVRRFRRDLLHAGMLAFAKSIPLSGTAHACGSLAMGEDPADSAVDAQGKVHGMRNLYVVDGSVLPRSSRVNPSLTIFAWALRVSALLMQQQEDRHHESDQQAVPA